VAEGVAAGTPEPDPEGTDDDPYSDTTGELARSGLPTRMPTEGFRRANRLLRDGYESFRLPSEVLRAS
jgi:hypothetical protein